MQKLLSSRTAVFATLAAFSLCGCDQPTGNSSSSPQPPSSQPASPAFKGTTPVQLPGTGAYVRLFEVEKGRWALAGAGNSWVATCSASEPVSDSVEFGETVTAPGWSVTVTMARLQDNRWYVLAQCNNDVAVTEALGQYSKDGKAVFTDPVTMEGWSTAYRTMKLWDGNTYLLVAGGKGMAVRPWDFGEKNGEAMPGNPPASQPSAATQPVEKP